MVAVEGEEGEKAARSELAVRWAPRHKPCSWSPTRPERGYRCWLVTV